MYFLFMLVYRTSLERYGYHNNVCTKPIRFYEYMHAIKFAFCVAQQVDTSATSRRLGLALMLIFPTQSRERWAMFCCSQCLQERACAINQSAQPQKRHHSPIRTQFRKQTQGSHPGHHQVRRLLCTRSCTPLTQSPPVLEVFEMQQPRHHQGRDTHKR
jgi:hypothetical protein